MKFKILSLFMVLLLILPVATISLATNYFVFADDGEAGQSYVVYDEKNNVISERSFVEAGDTFITKDFYEYEIYKIEGFKAYAKKIGKINVPSIKRDDLKSIPDQFSQDGSRKSKKICLYMTHNDESYLPSDGYDSIYGAGGIHDVAKKLKKSLENKGINVVLDQTLHIPHNSSAYSRSSVTANKLYSNENPDAMFDIHRDGVAKKYYLAKQGEREFSKVRIVVGKANPNFNENYKFAQNLFAIGNSMYPWLFLDIYCGKGHYNQDLQSTDLLFEMGTYLIEKESVFSTVPYLADVVNTALYASREEENGDITVDNKAPSTNNSPVVDTERREENKNSSWVVWVVLPIILGVCGISSVLIINYKNKKFTKKSAKKSRKQ